MTVVDLCTELSKSPVNDWERNFLASIAKREHLSDKQKACLEKIRAKYQPKPAVPVKPRKLRTTRVSSAPAPAESEVPHKPITTVGDLDLPPDDGLF